MTGTVDELTPLTDDFFTVPFSVTVFARWHRIVSQWDVIGWNRLAWSERYNFTCVCVHTSNRTELPLESVAVLLDQPVNDDALLRREVEFGYVAGNELGLESAQSNTMISVEFVDELGSLGVGPIYWHTYF